jgi:DNA-binding transcriptional LysR family regulator
MLDWDDVKIFLSLCADRTFAGAARKLGVDQTTVGRRLAAMERRLCAKLFERTPDGLLLTATGQEIWAAAQTMEQSAIAIERRAAGQDTRLAGSVRLTTTDTLANWLVLQKLSRFHQRYPDIQIELVTDSHILDIERREADMAIRVARPAEPQLVARRLGSLAIALYASRKYLATHLRPRPGEGLRGHDLIYYGTLRPAQGQPFLGEPLDGARFSFRSNSTLAQVNAAAAGFGIGALPCYLADSHPELVRLWRERSPEFQDVWLVIHQDVRRTARVRALAEFLVEIFKRAGQRLRGEPSSAAHPRPVRTQGRGRAPQALLIR